MAYGNPGPAPDLMTDEDPSSTKAAAAPEETEPEQEEAGNEATAEIPKSVLGGKEFKPGEEVVLEVVQVGENSVVVKYASEKGGEGEYSKEETPPEESPAAAPEPAGGGAASMMY